MVRRVTEVDEIIGIDGKTDEILYNRVFKYDPARDTFHYAGSSKLYDRIAERRNITHSSLLEEIRNRSTLLANLSQQPETDILEVAAEIRKKQWEWVRGE